MEDGGEVVVDFFSFGFDDVFDFGDGGFFDVGFGDPLDEHESFVFAGGDEGDGGALVSGAAGSADAVDVGVGVLGERVVDDVGEVGDVDASCGDVGGDEDVDFLFFEVVEGSFSLGLREIAMDGFGVVASVGEVACNGVDVAAGSTEDEAIEGVFDVDDSAEGLETVGEAYLEVYLLGEVGGELFLFCGDEFVAIHVFFGEFFDFGGMVAEKSRVLFWGLVWAMICSMSSMNPMLSIRRLRRG